MDSSSKPKKDMLHELLEGRVVGGTLSQLANYSDLFKRMAEAVFLVDRNSFRVLECNEAALQLLSSRESEILGFELPALLKAENFLGSLLSREFGEVEFVYHNERGDEMIFEISATPLKILDYIEVIQFIARDVTEVKKAERDLREMNAALTRLSTTDEMTGLKNYRYFKEVLQSVHHSANHQNESYGVIFIDVDHFKKFNDRNGHPAGDDVLRQVASILKSCARSQDLPARYGGEEFVMVCRHSSIESTAAVAEVIRSTIEGTAFPFGEHQPLGKVTVSIGVSAFPLIAGGFEAVLEAADQALYLSKEQGRNRVSFAGAGVPDSKKKAS
jgi:diguanylate cyclase (GGDEF)-like protein/PAS domain S-box-containing protein